MVVDLHVLDVERDVLLGFPLDLLLELSVGRIEAAAAVSLFMVVIAIVVLFVLRFLGPADAIGRTVRP